MLQITDIEKTKRSPKVLQFGGGNFLRAFAIWMIDILNTKTDFNGSVILIKPTDKGDYRSLRHQKGQYHVITKGIINDSLVVQSHIVQCISSIINPYNEWEAYLQSAEIPTIRFIISNTTESGITYSDSDKQSDTPPKEYPAKLTLWLYHRWKHFKDDKSKGCHILPCELINNNGSQLKHCVLQYIEHWQLELGFRQWIIEHNYFYNTLVDRIVSGYPKEGIDEIKHLLQFEDDLIVVTEPYSLWAIEGNRDLKKELPLDRTNLNVVFTNDISKYRELKIRILNGAHIAMVPLGFLNGNKTVLETIIDSDVSILIYQIVYNEILPTLDYPSEILNTYADEIMDRFKNPYIRHELMSISLNAISKFKNRLLPTLLDYHTTKKTFPSGIITSLASLFIYYRGHFDNIMIDLRDNEYVIAYFKNIWLHWDKTHDTESLVREILQQERFWDCDLSEIEGLVEAIVIKINTILQSRSN